ncbi:MAG: AgmX/PglI C-terminal domain-containing protein, partial [Myxococcota bacterium]
ITDGLHDAQALFSSLPTEATAPLEHKPAVERQAVGQTQGVAAQTTDGATESAEVASASATVGASGLIVTADGAEVEPFTLQGYYDEQGNYIPGYYDKEGAYHYGYGYFDDDGEWVVAYGYYDPDGEWVETQAPEEEVVQPSEREYYTEVYFAEEGGDTLEVVMLWADQVLSVTSYAKPRSVLVGSTKNVDFPLEDPSIKSAEFPLVVYEGGTYALTVSPEMGVLIQNNDQQFSLDEVIRQGAVGPSQQPGCYTIPLGSGTSARVDIGAVTFIVHFTDQPPLAGLPVGFDSAPIPYLFMSAVAHLTLLFLALTMPEDPSGLDLDSLSANDRFVELLVTPDQVEEEEPDFFGKTEEMEAAKHKGEEGKAGKQDEEVTDKRMAIKGPPDNTELELKRARDTEIAMNTGALAALNDMVASPFGNAMESVGSDTIHALGNLDGTGGPGVSGGIGGLGLSGSGRGGGGISESGIGMSDGITQGGRGGFNGEGGRSARRANDLGQKNSKVPKIVPGKPRVMGSLDKEIIRQVVRRHRNEIRFCYEQQLQKNPKLAGTVNVKFTISNTGAVISAIVATTTLKNAKVETCMTGKIRRWVFPEPKGGGIVIVNYPFKLSS